MNRSLLVVTIVATLIFPAPAHAAPEEEYRTALQELAELLTRQVAALTAELQAVRDADLERSRERSSGPAAFYASEFYNGPYVAVYTVHDSGLALALGRAEHAHARVFGMFRAIADGSFVEAYIAEFRVYDSTDAETSAFIDQIGASDRWILGVNMADVDLGSTSGRGFLRNLLIHETGHVLIHGNPEARRVFAKRFWSEADREHAARVKESGDPYEVTLPYYRSNRSRFVSEYATRDPLEDMAESFTHFVTRGTRGLSGEAEEKVRFFERYAVFRDARDGIRGRLRR